MIIFPTKHFREKIWLIVLISLLLFGCEPGLDIQLPAADGLNAYYPIGIHDASPSIAAKLVISRYGTAKPIMIYLPGGEGPFPLVMFQHGRPFSMPSNYAYYPQTALINATVESGYALAVVVRQGYFGVPGADNEAVPCNRPKLQDFRVAGSAAAINVQQAHDYLRRLSFVDSNNIVLAGSSAGGFASINALPLLDGTIKAMVSINGGRCGKQGDAIGGLAALRSLYGSIAETVASPVYFLSGGNDTTIPVYSTRALFMSFCRVRNDCVKRTRTKLFEKPNATHNVATMVDVYTRALKEISSISMEVK
ncbi:MAG: hypothetical protein JKY86_09385 [Gammaproteobacteria bacterium]|nr:hypothetical protein [Gammaproteobacteria bacterium]